MVSARALLSHPSSLLFLALAVLSAASILARRPWTAPLARSRTPPEVWDTPLFRETNDVVTGLWTLAFLAAAIVLPRFPWWVALLVGPAFYAAGRSSDRFAKWYVARRLGSMGIE